MHSGKVYGNKRWQKDKGRETLQFSLPRSDNAVDDDTKPLPSLVKGEFLVIPVVRCSMGLELTFALCHKQRSDLALPC